MTSATQEKWEGRWEQLVGRVKSLWGTLTADEHLQFEGEYERRVGAKKVSAAVAREEFLERVDERAQS